MVLRHSVGEYVAAFFLNPQAIEDFFLLYVRRVPLVDPPPFF